MTDKTLEEKDEDAGVLLADGFGKAFIGYVTQFNTILACYDYSKCIKILVKRDGMDEIEAVDFMDFNVTGAWMGKYTPCFLRKCNLKEFKEFCGEREI
jgi:hypothetical protein